MEKNLKQKNKTLFWTLLGVAILMFVVTLIRVHEG